MQYSVRSKKLLRKLGISPAFIVKAEKEGLSLKSVVIVLKKFQLFQLPLGKYSQGQKETQLG